MPLKTDLPLAAPTSPIFLGGINLYLQQASALAGYLPGVLRRWLDRPGVLRWVSGLAVRTEARDLGPMTVSVLSGVEGRMRGEFERLAEYLAREFRPDVVHLSNSLLSGLASIVRQKTGARVVCTLQGEEHFVAGLPELHRARAMMWLRLNSGEIDYFMSCAGAGWAAK